MVKSARFAAAQSSTQQTPFASVSRSARRRCSRAFPVPAPPWRQVFLRGINQQAALDYSFVLGIPSILAAAVLTIKDAIGQPVDIGVGAMIAGVVTAAVVASAGSALVIIHESFLFCFDFGGLLLFCRRGPGRTLFFGCSGSGGFFRLGSFGLFGGRLFGLGLAARTGGAAFTGRVRRPTGGRTPPGSSGG